MGSNKLELILSLVDSSEQELMAGTKKSCDAISSMLLRHIQGTANNQRQPPIPSIDLKLVASPGNVNVTEGWDYAILAAYSIRSHMRFLSAAAENILGGFREALESQVSSLQRTETPQERVFENRPHSLGGIRPPSPSTVAREAMKYGGCLNDLNLIKEAMGKLEMEKETFEREHRLNDRLRKYSNTAGEGGAIIYAPSSFRGTPAPAAEGPVDRSVEEGAAWRPQLRGDRYPWWWYEFSNMWGDKGPTRNTLKQVMARAVVPKAKLARAVAIMCAHLKNCASVVLNTEMYCLLDKPFSSREVWVDLIYVKLEWFSLVASLVLFLEERKEEVTHYLSMGREARPDNGVQLAINTIESLPPWLLSKTWTDRNLYDWPEKLSEERRAEAKDPTEVVFLSMLERFLEWKPGEQHPIIPPLRNESNRIIRHRLSIAQAHFLGALINRAQQELKAGTQWLIKKRRRDATDGATPPSNFKVFIKNEANVSSPLFSNRGYRTRLLPGQYVDQVNECLAHMLIRDTGKESSKWTTLDLCVSLDAMELGCFWKRVSPSGIDYSSAETHLVKEKSELTLHLDSKKENSTRQTKAIDENNRLMTDFLSSLNASNSNAERAIFLTSVWKTCADRIFRLLSNTADL